MVSYKLVDISAIRSDQPRSNFSESEIEEIADLFLSSGILVKPIIVKETSPDNFMVVYGHKEYYGSVRAREKNQRKAEMVNAFVVDRKDSEEVQAALLKQANQLLGDPISKIMPALTTIDARVDSENFRQRVNSEDFRQLDIRINNLESRINQQQQALQQFQQQFSSDIEQKLKAVAARIPERRSLLEEINTLEAHKLLLRLQGLGVSSAATVCEQILKERKKKAFRSFQDVVDRLRNPRGHRQFSAEKMLELIDIASQTLLLD